MGLSSSGPKLHLYSLLRLPFIDSLHVSKLRVIYWSIFACHKGAKEILSNRGFQSQIQVAMKYFVFGLES